MKKLLFAAFAVALIAFSNNSNAQEMKVKKSDDKLKAKPAAMKKDTRDQEMKMKMDMGMNLAYPYKAEYSSQFAFGKPEQAKLVLDMWKDWDNNTLDNHLDVIADSIVFELPNGEVLRGKENFIAKGKEQRNTIASANSTVEAWMPLRSIDRNEDWVAVWGYEQDTNKDGKVSVQRLHEIWGFNKDGKISYVRQYTSQVPKQQ